MTMHAGNKDMGLAQQNMQQVYFCGAPGVLISGLVWLVAGFTAKSFNDETGLITLLLAGMLIFPLSLVLTKLLGRSAKHDKSNPLGPLALEVTFWMLLSLPLVLLLANNQVAYGFIGMLIIIGGRYLTFTTLYGLRHYYVLGACLAIFAMASFILALPSTVIALGGGSIEVIFSLYLFWLGKSSDASQPPMLKEQLTD